jgi:hypothetical protein
MYTYGVGTGASRLIDCNVSQQISRQTVVHLLHQASGSVSVWTCIPVGTVPQPLSYVESCPNFILLLPSFYFCFAFL